MCKGHAAFIAMAYLSDYGLCWKRLALRSLRGNLLIEHRLIKKSQGEGITIGLALHCFNRCKNG
jgi:hypothetical protein